MERISKTDHEYAGRQLKAGERFECEAQHVGLLLTLGRIEPEVGEPGYQLTQSEPRRERQRPRRGTPAQ